MHRLLRATAATRPVKYWKEDMNQTASCDSTEDETV